MKRIIICGEQGSGKNLVGVALADALGVALIPCWNGEDALPAHCVATTNIDIKDIPETDAVVLQLARRIG